MKKLDGASCWVEELTKVNAILTNEVTSLQESMDKAKAEAFEEYKDLQLFFNLLWSQYDEGFKDFKKQSIVLFPNVDFSFVQIDTMVPMTPWVDNEIVDVEDENEDAPKKVVAPQVIQGNNPLQHEGTTEDQAVLVPTVWRSLMFISLSL